MSKIALLSYSGTCGKTMTAMHLFLPRMPDAVFYAIETINLSAADLGAKNVRTLKGKDFGELIEDLVLEDDAIVDVGASNIEPFIEAMSRFAGADEEIDLYVIPVTPEQKSYLEGISTAAALAEFGIPKERIVLLPNRIEEDPEAEIPAAFNFVKQKKCATIHKEAFLYESEVFGYLNHHKTTFPEVVADNTDYKAKARAAESKADRTKYSQLHRWQRQAIPIHNHLDIVYQTIMKG
ncbi:StbB family protein [Salinicola sp. NYA28a]